MSATIREGHTPSFLLMEYSLAWEVQGLTVVHHSLITQECIEERRALGPTARRAGWIGCNIILTKIAIEGRIPLVVAGNVLAREASRTALHACSFFRTCPRSDEAGLHLCSISCANFPLNVFP